VLNDLRYGFRALQRNPAVTVTAVVALALGISSNTAMFSLADAFLFKPLALNEPERLVMLPETRGDRPIAGTSNVAPANFEDWKRQATSFEQLAACRLLSFNITGQGDPEGVYGSRVSSGLFELVGARPLMGRVFRAEEDQPGREQVVVLSYGLWRRRFASDPEIIGKTVRLDGKPYTVTGVMAEDYHFPLAAELWTPMAMGDQERAIRGTRYMDVVGRLKRGVSERQAAAEMETIAKRLGQAYPETNRGWHVRVMPIRDFLLGDLTRNYTWMLLGAVGFVLLIACANVANLQFARATFRVKEIAVRTALGAGRWGITRLLLTESVLLGLAGAAGGILLAQWDLDMVRAHMPAEIGRWVSGWDQIHMDGRTLLFTLLVAVAAGIVSGLAPALHSSKPDLNEALKESVRGSSEGRSQGRLRSVLLTGEIALALVLLVGAGLMVKGVHSLISVNENLTPESLLTMRISLPESKYKEPRQIAAFYSEALAALETLPHVQAATVTTDVPYGDLGGSLPFTIEGRPADPGEIRVAKTQYISPNYFSMMRVAVREGRVFSAHDGTDSQPVAIVSENLARRYWPGSSALGRKIKLDPDGQWLTIVGVAEDVRYEWFNATPRPAIYRPYMQTGRPYGYLALRTSGDPLALVSGVRQRIATVDAELPVFEVMTLEKVISESVLGLSYVAVMMTVLGGIALVLACVGVYGVMAYAVSERTREIGIRIALGAERTDVLRMVIGRGLVVTGIGLSIGFVASLLLARLLASFIFGVSSTDWQIFGGISLALAAAAILACYVPARRAMGIDPVEALRYE
jgi:putative ABC transport system permease protein